MSYFLFLSIVDKQAPSANSQLGIATARDAGGRTIAPVANWTSIGEGEGGAVTSVSTPRIRQAGVDEATGIQIGTRPTTSMMLTPTMTLISTTIGIMFEIAITTTRTTEGGATTIDATGCTGDMATEAEGDATVVTVIMTRTGAITPMIRIAT